METQNMTRSLSSSAPQQQPGDFTPGSTVIYPMFGKCTVLATETREIGGESIPFYKLEVQRSAFSRSSRQEPAIWVPVRASRERGLRSPMAADQLQAVYDIFSSREYYFDAKLGWSQVLPQLEATIRAEGIIGLAKVASYLHVLKKKQIVPTSEVARMSESVNKMLFRELTDVTGEPIRALEEKTNKMMRQKLLPDV